MKSDKRLHRAMDHLARRLAGERGIVVVVVMMFCLIFLVLGIALYWLSTSQITATETERKDVKSFNVAEAGVDAGMLALKLNWPFSSSDYVTVDYDLVKTALQDLNETLYDPERSDASEFLQVSVYDNSVYDTSVEGDYRTVTSAPDEAEQLHWDANDDGMMFVDATSNVQDARHRILLVAERQVWNLYFPISVALRSGAVDSNGQGFGIEMEVPPPSGMIYYDVGDTEGKGIEEFSGVYPWTGGEISFDSVITPTLINALMSIAMQKGTYFEDDAATAYDADVEAQAFLTSGDADGSVVYVKSDSAVSIKSSVQIGTVDAPVVVVLDTPSGSQNVWDMGGGAELYGILVCLGDSELAGTCSTHGAVYVEGSLLNSGNGVDEELQYNYDVLVNINRQFVLNVSIVPNTWEEYTTPAEE